jgi:hypothetical protein
MDKKLRYSLALFVLCLTVGLWFWQQGKNPFGAPPDTSYTNISPDAKWPWVGATTKTVALGVTQTTTKTADGTTLDFIDFDFGKNPKLRFEIFDQDEDDEKPLDNRVTLDKRGVIEVARKLEANGRGKVIAAWNGAFFGYDRANKESKAFHVSPVILRGKVLFNTAQHRWTFGVKNTATGPVWKALFKPSRQVMEKEFDFGAGSLQYLIREGKPLTLESFPAIGSAFKDQPVPSTENEAGHIPYFDHMRTSRASLAWSKDNRHLYLLAVKEPDMESSSSLALSFAVRGESIPPNTTLGGGWTVADVQKFWENKGVWGAMNSDAGDVLQLALKEKDSSYDLIPPRIGSDKMRLIMPMEAPNLKKGGALMYFYICENS